MSVNTKSSDKTSAAVACGEQSAKAKPTRTIRKRLCFTALTFLLTIAFAELAVRVFLGLSANFSLDELRRSQQRTSYQQRDDSAPSEAIHPYLGWVINPDANHKQHVNQLGFFGDVPIIEKRQPNKLRIAIAGGSVAFQMTQATAELMTRRLKARPQFKDFEIQIIGLALSGYKQPQQLLQLNYLMSLGAEFDVVINLDGFNEVALHRQENGRNDVFYAYPRAWNFRMVNAIDPLRAERSFQAIELQVARIRLAKWIQRAPYRYSALLNIYWFWRDEWLRAELVSHAVDVVQMKLNDGLGYQIAGPRGTHSSDEELFGQLADLWMNASLQTHRLCTANGMTYLHFLQPNQHVEGSKTLSDNERRNFVYPERDPDKDYAESVIEAYPLLSERGEALVANGVRFHDLTMIFSETTETVYADACCHFNERGYEILAKRIVDELIRSLEADIPD